MILKLWNKEQDGSNYTVARTSSESTLLGMDSTVWTWLIVGIAAIAIFALIWYYTMQPKVKNYDDKE